MILCISFQVPTRGLPQPDAVTVAAWKKLPDAVRQYIRAVFDTIDVLVQELGKINDCDRIHARFSQDAVDRLKFLTKEQGPVIADGEVYKYSVGWSTSAPKIQWMQRAQPAQQQPAQQQPAPQPQQPAQQQPAQQQPVPSTSGPKKLTLRINQATNLTEDIQAVGARSPNAESTVLLKLAQWKERNELLETCLAEIENKIQNETKDDLYTAFTQIKAQLMLRMPTESHL